jgi:hypothetical protein
MRWRWQFPRVHVYRVAEPGFRASWLDLRVRVDGSSSRGGYGDSGGRTGVGVVIGPVCVAVHWKRWAR